MTFSWIDCVARRLAAPLAALAVLAGCGGGDRVEPFEPTALTVFGDEASLVAPGGARWTVNLLLPDAEGGGIDCNANRIWVQQVAASFGLRLPNCGSVDPAPSRSFAALGAGVVELRRQIDAALAERPFNSDDLVTVYAGQKDLLDLYATATSAADCSFAVGNSDAAGPVARLALERGRRVAGQVNRIVDNGDGGRVLFVTVPSLRFSPFGRAETAAHTDFDRGVCLLQLSQAFNSGLRTTVVQDGRLVGLVQLDEQIELAVRELLGFADTETAVCAAVLPGCTIDTLIADVTVDEYLGYLWADATHFSASMQSRLGSIALSRAQNNPF